MKGKTYKGKSMRPGGGGAFAKLVDKLKAKGKVSNPKAVAASIGRKKIGKAKMAKYAAQGKHRASMKGGPK